MTSLDIYHILKSKVSFEREEFWVIGLDPQKNIIFCQQVFLGTLRKCKIYPREIFRIGLVHNADQLVIAHSHPAVCSVLPSKADVKITRDLIQLGKTLDLEIVDHIIIGPKKYFSFFDEGFSCL